MSYSGDPILIQGGRWFLHSCAPDQELERFYLGNNHLASVRASFSYAFAVNDLQSRGGRGASLSDAKKRAEEGLIAYGRAERAKL